MGQHRRRYRDARRETAAVPAAGLDAHRCRAHGRSVVGRQSRLLHGPLPLPGPAHAPGARHHPGRRR